jgi:hypothetical protein
MDPREPERWSAQSGDGDAEELLAGIRAARAEGPSAEQLARMRAALSLPASLPPAAGPGWLLKLIVGALVVAGASFGAWRALQPDEIAPPVSQSAAKEVPQSAPGAEPPVLDRDAALEPAVAPAPQVESPSALAKPKRAAAPRRAAENGPRAPEPAEGAPVDVEAELAILRPARAHVRSAPKRALELVAEHARRYPRGALIEEREVIAIEALLTSARVDDAAARARSFFADYPRSAHARRVRSLLDQAGAGTSAHE